jgi:hypothetical protein
VPLQAAWVVTEQEIAALAKDRGKEIANTKSAK